MTLDKLKQEDVVGMAKADMCLFVLEDAFSILLVVVDVDDNPSEETEWGKITSLHHNGIALPVFQSQSSKHLANGIHQAFNKTKEYDQQAHEVDGPDNMRESKNA